MSALFDPRNRMASRNRVELDILCPNCGAYGEALASEDDDPLDQNPRFQMDEYPEGFYEARPSDYR